MHSPVENPIERRHDPGMFGTPRVAYGRRMTRRTPAVLLVTATAALGLAACSHPAPTGTGATARRSPATAGFGQDPADQSGGQDQPTPDSAGTGAPAGAGTHTGRPSPGPSRSVATGPQIVSFTATGAVCPAQGPAYSHPGQVTVSWKTSGGDGVSLAIDGGLWRTYPGPQGSDTLPFACPAAGKTNTHRYTLTITDTAVTKTVSASAPAEP
jgi:hypothetical protein